MVKIFCPTDDVVSLTYPYWLWFEVNREKYLQEYTHFYIILNLYLQNIYMICVKQVAGSYIFLQLSQFITVLFMLM